MYLGRRDVTIPMPYEAAVLTLRALKVRRACLYPCATILGTLSSPLMALAHN